MFGGAIGLTIGSVTHGHDWLAVLALVVVAGVSGVLSAASDIGSVTGLQLLVYTALGAGPVGALRPVWHTAAGFLVGVIWALLLIVPSWLLSPHSKEQRDVAAVYDALAAQLRAIGTSQFTAARQQLTSALNVAYDELLTARSTATGRNRRTMRLVAGLNASPGRCARGVSAHDVRAAVDQPPGYRLAARGGRPGAGHGRGDLDRARGQPGRQRAAVRGRHAVGGAAGGERGGLGGDGAGDAPAVAR